MNRDEFFDGLRRRLDWPDLGPETKLPETERWDSLAQVEVVMYVQDELGETLVADQLQRVATGAELAALIEGKLSWREAS